MLKRTVAMPLCLVLALIIVALSIWDGTAWIAVVMSIIALLCVVQIVRDRRAGL
jgi:hypothetical protein